MIDRRRRLYQRTGSRSETRRPALEVVGNGRRVEQVADVASHAGALPRGLRVTSSRQRSPQADLKLFIQRAQDAEEMVGFRDESAEDRPLLDREGTGSLLDCHAASLPRRDA